MLYPFLGVELAHVTQDIRLDGSVPGFGLDFLYRTDLDILQVSPKAGALLTVPLIADSSGPAIISIEAKGTVFIDTLVFNGKDRLTLDGPADDFQSVSLDGSDTEIGFRIEGGLVVRPPGMPLIFNLTGGFEQRGNAAVVHRSGETGDQSEAKSAISDSFYATIGISLALPTVGH